MVVIRTLPRCPPGQFYAAQPPQDKQSDRGWCYKCLPGTFSNERNRDTQCKNCTVCSQEQGLVEMQPCLSTADTVCRCRDHYVSEHSRCQPIEPTAALILPRTTIETEMKLVTSANTKSARILRVLEGSITPIEVGEPHSIFEPEAVESTKSLKTIDRSVHASRTKWPLEKDDARNVVTTTHLGVKSHTEIHSGSVAFYFGDTPVTTAMLAMGIVSFLSIVALAAVAVTLCVKRWRRNNGGKRQSVEVSAESEYHIYEDPETLLTEVLPPLRLCLVTSGAEAVGCASHNQDHPSLGNASENSFAPLLGNHISAGHQPAARCDVGHARASIFEESNPLTSLATRPVTGIISNAARVSHNNFFASETSDCTDSVAAPSTAATDIKIDDLPTEAAVRCVDLTASSDKRAVGGGSDRLDCACKTKAGAIAAVGMRDGGYIYSRAWGQLQRSTQPAQCRLFDTEVRCHCCVVHGKV